jgi:negative regulator of sigma-B (phosphoserine phosphatase)
MGSDRPEVLDWSVAAKPFPGEIDSGDDAVVAPLPDGALVAAVDGLGHGAAAAHAAARAVELLRTHATEPLVLLVNRCHEALKGTRGAAMSVARFCVRDDTMTWLGVGNVEGRLVRGRNGHPSNETLIVPGGAAGFQLQRLRTETHDVQPGDTLVLATDGIDFRFADSLDVIGSADEIATGILREHARPNDDALVLVARYLGPVS